MRKLSICWMKCKERIPVFEMKVLVIELLGKISGYMTLLMEIKDKTSMIICTSYPENQNFRTEP